MNVHFYYRECRAIIIFPGSAVYLKYTLDFLTVLKSSTTYWKTGRNILKHIITLCYSLRQNVSKDPDSRKCVTNFGREMSFKENSTEYFSCISYFFKSKNATVTVILSENSTDIASKDVQFLQFSVPILTLSNILNAFVNEKNLADLRFKIFMSLQNSDSHLIPCISSKMFSNLNPQDFPGLNCGLVMRQCIRCFLILIRQKVHT